MTLPDNTSEAVFLEITQNIAKILYPKFGNLHGSESDFYQEVVVWSLLALPRYDASRALGAFLFSHARNRAINAIRDKVTRRDHPCASCHAGTPCTDGEYCPKYAKWYKRNKTKARLSRPLGFSSIPAQAEPWASTSPSAMLAAVEARDTAEMIERKLPLELREHYRNLLAGKDLKPSQRNRVRLAVSEILNAPSPGPVSAEQQEAQGRCDAVVLMKRDAA